MRRNRPFWGLFRYRLLHEEFYVFEPKVLAPATSHIDEISENIRAAELYYNKLLIDFPYRRWIIRRSDEAHIPLRIFSIKDDDAQSL